MKSIYLSFIFVIVFFMALSGCKQNEKVSSISLAGDWELSLDSSNVEDIGQLDFNLKVKLPGTLDEAGIGKENTMQPEMKRETMLHLQRKHEYIGKAWYRKVVSIPESAKDEKSILILERVLWKSTVYVDEKMVGSANSLTVPHKYDLTKFLSPGKHEILICIDNTKQFNLNRDNMAHAYTNETQVMWNGILGKFEIEFVPVSGIKNVQVYTNMADSSVTAKVDGKLLNADQLDFTVYSILDKKEVAHQLFQANDNKTYKIKINRKIHSWNEFSPSLYQLVIKLIRKNEKEQLVSTEFGFRSIKADGKKLLVNGQPVFLRGTLDCCIFPLTGHPPVKKDKWLDVFKTIKSYGLNHIRFHSWCPPEAAFLAADQVGLYLQVELPNWSLSYGKDTASADFIEAEANRIISTYGNHPSFCFLSMGNELEGDFNRLDSLVTNLKGKDKRHLYTATTFTFQKGHGKFPESVDDYFITQYTDNGWVRGQGVFDSEYPNFAADYTKAVKGLPVPLITHEIGQYSVYPDLTEIPKYTGVLDPVNFKAIRNDLQQKGLLHLANDYMMASGKLAALLYKEEIERALKTDGISGFQLLDLQDFPGQGTALVGLLNAFWQSKGIIDSTEFKEFCSEVVPLIWMDKAVYKNNENLRLYFGVANYLKPLPGQRLQILLKEGPDKVLLKKEFKQIDIPSGRTSKLGLLEFPLNDIREAKQLTIELSIEGTNYRNSWPIWVYPKGIVDDHDNRIIETRSFEEAQKALKEGKKVFLNPKLKDLKGLEGKFVQVFWSPVHFPDQPGTMGLLIDPKHPAFNYFPTEFHSNWQWWDLCKHSKTLNFGDLTIKPLVRVIDNFYKNRNLTNLFEAKVGNGKLIFSSIDLTDRLDKRPEANQLKYSILKYMESDDFNPDNKIDFEQLRREFFEE